jgi:beta-lactamase superfamily II metal-dependent hydrolase
VPAEAEDALRIFFADVEGGQATLFVTPEGESLLVDTGWPGFDGRDADRIAKICKQAGVTKIDSVLITHFHVDHVGGVPQLVAKVPVGRFIDHGPNREMGDPATEKGWAAYNQTVSGGKFEHLSVKVGDKLPISGMNATVVSADGEVLRKPLTGGGAGDRNSSCAASPEKPIENSENDRSVGLMITFGQARILDLGDLTWGKERPLMCPVDKLGRVDLYIASHHGLARSNSPALVNAVAPRVVVMDNGGHKGADASAWETVKGTSRLADLWQVHTAEGSDAAHNAPESRIANLPGPDSGHFLEARVQKDGAIAVTNERTGETATYGPAPAGPHLK